MYIIQCDPGWQPSTMPDYQIPPCSFYFGYGMYSHLSSPPTHTYTYLHPTPCHLVTLVISALLLSKWLSFIQFLVPAWLGGVDNQVVSADECTVLCRVGGFYILYSTLARTTDRYMGQNAKQGTVLSCKSATR